MAIISSNILFCEKQFQRRREQAALVREDKARNDALCEAYRKPKAPPVGGMA